MYLNMHIKIQGGPSFPSPQSMATLALCQELAFVTCGFEVYKTTTDVVKNETSWSVQKQT
jgi:hypothetical protein